MINEDPELMNECEDFALSFSIKKKRIEVSNFT